MLIWFENKNNNNEVLIVMIIHSNMCVIYVSLFAYILVEIWINIFICIFGAFICMNAYKHINKHECIWNKQMLSFGFYTTKDSVNNNKNKI